MNKVDNDHLSTARVNLYQLLARALGPVADMDETDPQLLHQICPKLSGDLRDSAASLAIAWEAALDDRLPLAVAQARLFLGPFEILAPPYESLYLDPEQRLMGQVSQSVACAYAEAGLAPGPGPNEVPDHITHELEFMYFVGFQAISTGEPIWSARQQQFRTDHLSRWLPLLAGDILRADVHPFYNALAQLLSRLF
jgi:TorA maturation chaperone TorD